MATIVGNKVAPWLMERYLARTAYGSQQMKDLPVDLDRPDNLFEPLDRDEGAHGRFDDRAHAHSLQLRLSELRPLWRRASPRPQVRPPRRCSPCER